MNDEELMKQRTKKTDVEHLDLHSADIGDEKRAELLRLFPEVRTEGGKLDFDRLKLALGETADVGKERYGMTWPGKADCFKTIQRPSVGTLRPAPKESINFDATENLIIEGDNLEVLKLLQKSYLGKVKMIYIDPPYNTGNDFIYPDDFSENLQTYLQYTGQTDSEGKSFGTNTDTDGRFHSKWLRMMYPRLYLARNLLTPDGAILVSIGDDELPNLLATMNEIFGEVNRIGIFLWKSRAKPTNAGDARFRVQKTGEYVLAYGLRPGDEIKLNVTPSKTRVYPHKDNDGQYRTTTILTSNRGMFRRETMRFTSGGFTPDEDNRWKAGKETIDDLFARKRILFNDDGVPLEKKYEHEETDPLYPVYSFMDPDLTGTAETGKADLNAVLGNQHGMDTVKPVALLKYFAATFASPGDYVLDFFAGSGTTAQAVLELNAEGASDRHYIMVQLPEPMDHKDYKTIAEMMKDRIRRVGKRLEDADAGLLVLDAKRKTDRGFRFFKLDESNFKSWNADVSHDPEALKKQLELHVDHVRKGRTPDDLLVEILLKSGFPLTTPVEKITLAGMTVHSVAEGALFVCLEDQLTLELIRAMADRKPERVVCLDQGFAGADQLKANAVQIFKTKGVTSFKTV